MKQYSHTNIFNDPSRLSYTKKVEPLNNTNTLNRFETDISLNGRTIFEDKNNMINSLNEEIISLKKKLKFVYEKDKEIQELTIKNSTYEHKLKEYKSYETENIKILQENKDNQDKINELYKVSSELANEKHVLELTNERLLQENKQLLETIQKNNKESTESTESTEIINEIITTDIKPIDASISKIHDIDYLKNIIRSNITSSQSEKLDTIFLILKINSETEITRELIQNILKLL